MKYDFDEIIERADTNSIKYGVGKLANPLLPEDFIPMWIADMDFACPEQVLEAIRLRLDKKILGYSMFLNPEYYGAVAGWMKRRFDWEIDPSQLLFSPGIVPALNNLVELLTEPGDGVMIQTPVYGPFLKAIVNHGRTPVFNSLINTSGYYTMDYEDLEEKAKDPANKLILFCSPHNPSGRVWTEEELKRAADICLGNGVTIVSDEIHADLTRTGIRHIPLAKLYPDCKEIITCTSPSKTFNMAGTQLSNILVPDEALRKRITQLHDDLPSPLSIEAAQAAYTQCDDWLDSLKLYLDRNLDLVRHTLDQKLPQAVFRRPEGTYLAWIDMSGTGLVQEEIMTVTARDAGIFLEGGEQFVHDGEGFVRINCACPYSLLQKALDRFCTAFAPYHS